eukprot:CAMPEP_0185553106 /NCGR_PEP_ID=MMETSP1381-20130426/36451_1 /TAXON_ID=298111 /ORGANISM="Pavlova sp., Strain CCMP459" /LENGTH=73 /DNA_ID=CAMNT_0028166177 /DNA_START=16 /DNA_END=234 /DNA_ORIENTATION=-
MVTKVCTAASGGGPSGGGTRTTQTVQIAHRRAAPHANMAKVERFGAEPPSFFAAAVPTGNETSMQKAMSVPST